MNEGRNEYREAENRRNVQHTSAQATGTHHLNISVAGCSSMTPSSTSKSVGNSPSHSPSSSRRPLFDDEDIGDTMSTMDSYTALLASLTHSHSSHSFHYEQAVLAGEYLPSPSLIPNTQDDSDNDEIITVIRGHTSHDHLVKLFAQSAIDPSQVRLSSGESHSLDESELDLDDNSAQPQIQTASTSSQVPSITIGQKHVTSSSSSRSSVGVIAGSSTSLCDIREEDNESVSPKLLDQAASSGTDASRKEAEMFIKKGSPVVIPKRYSSQSLTRSSYSLQVEEVHIISSDEEEEGGEGHSSTSSVSRTRRSPFRSMASLSFPTHEVSRIRMYYAFLYNLHQQTCSMFVDKKDLPRTTFLITH